MLPVKWVDRIFAHLMALYGSRFLDMWRGTDLAAVKVMWAEKLGGFESNPDAIKAALDALDDKPFPPTLPEFLHLCRDAARRAPPTILALDHKLSAEDIAKNRARIAAITEQLGRKMTAGSED